MIVGQWLLASDEVLILKCLQCVIWCFEKCASDQVSGRREARRPRTARGCFFLSPTAQGKVPQQECLHPATWVYGLFPPKAPSSVLVPSSYVSRMAPQSASCSAHIKNVPRIALYGTPFCTSAKKAFFLILRPLLLQTAALVKPFKSSLCVALQLFYTGMPCALAPWLFSEEPWPKERERGKERWKASMKGIMTEGCLIGTD